MAPMPRLNVKNACPIASSTPSAVSLLASNLKRKLHAAPKSPTVAA